MLAKLGDVFGEAMEFRIDDRIGAEGWKYAGFPAGVSNCQVVGEWVERAVGCGEDLNFETLVEGARQKLRRGQFFADGVIVKVGGLL